MSIPYPPAPPSSPAARRPHVVVYPPEEDCDEPWCFYDADEPLDTDPDVLHAIHSIDNHEYQEEQDSEIYEVVRVKRRRASHEKDDDQPTPKQRVEKRRSSFFGFKKQKPASPVEDDNEEEPAERSTSPTPTFLSRRRFSFFASTPSLSSFTSLSSMSSQSRSSTSTSRPPALSRRSESNSSISDQSAGPDTPTDDLSPASSTHSQTQEKPKSGGGILRRLSSFRRPRSATQSQPPFASQPQPQPKPQPQLPLPVEEDTEGEMRLDSFHFDEGISFDADRFQLKDL